MFRVLKTVLILPLVLLLLLCVLIALAVAYQCRADSLSDETP